MTPPRLAVELALWVAGGCLLAVWASAQDEGALQPPMKQAGPPGALLCSGTEPSDPRCPRKKKAATLVPSFTKTTTSPTTTHHPTMNTTHHPTMNTTHHPTSNTTHHPTTNTTHHPTTHATNHTSRPANHTTLPANHTTPHPTNHTTSFHTATPVHHTTAPHPSNHTTPPAIVTTPLWPTDTPLVVVGHYAVQNGSTTCLRLEAGLQVQVQYTNKAKQQLWGAFALQPNHTNVSGACSSQEATLQLRFPEGFLIFDFKKNETKGTSYLSRVQASLNYQFQQATEASFGANSSSLREFEASLGHSYQCRNRTLSLSGRMHLRVLNERVQAFELQGGKFGEAEVCKEQRHSPLVPIIVIVVLVLLVIIVLVAYVVGRRRSHTGYETL